MALSDDIGMISFRFVGGEGEIEHRISSNCYTADLARAFKLFALAIGHYGIDKYVSDEDGGEYQRGYTEGYDEGLKDAKLEEK